LYGKIINQGSTGHCKSSRQESGGQEAGVQELQEFRSCRSCRSSGVAGVQGVQGAEDVFSNSVTPELLQLLNFWFLAPE
jgi:hypothetical protein